jgi:putative polyhydroxyalkanoate system protein
MATIDLRRAHTLSKDEAKSRAETLAKNMQEKFGIVWRWAGDSITFETPSGTAKGTKGEVSVSDSEVRVQIDLPFMLKVIKGTVESRVADKLKELL